MTPRKFVEYPEDYGPSYDELVVRVAELVKRGNAMAEAFEFFLDGHHPPPAFVAWREVVPEEGT